MSLFSSIPSANVIADSANSSSPINHHVSIVPSLARHVPARSRSRSRRSDRSERKNNNCTSTDRRRSRSPSRSRSRSRQHSSQAEVYRSSPTSLSSSISSRTIGIICRSCHVFTSSYPSNGFYYCTTCTRRKLTAHSSLPVRYHPIHTQTSFFDSNPRKQQTLNRLLKDFKINPNADITFPNFLKSILSSNRLLDLEMTERLPYCATRLEVMKGPKIDPTIKPIAVGTGFYFTFEYEYLKICVIITNKHLLTGSPSVTSDPSQLKVEDTYNKVIGWRSRPIQPQVDQDGRNIRLLPVSSTFDCAIKLSPDTVVWHPDPAIDLAGFLCDHPTSRYSDLALANKRSRISLYEKHIRFCQEMLQFSQTLESVHMVGFPFGFHDDEYCLPLIRTGATAYPPSIDWKKEPYGLADIENFVGSSGSPVFLVVRDRMLRAAAAAADTTVPDTHHTTLMLFLGINFATLSQGLTSVSSDSLVPQLIPTAFNQEESMTHSLIPRIAVYIRSEEILQLRDQVIRKNFKAEVLASNSMTWGRMKPFSRENVIGLNPVHNFLGKKELTKFRPIWNDSQQHLIDAIAIKWLIAPSIEEHTCWKTTSDAGVRVDYQKRLSHLSDTVDFTEPRFVLAVQPTGRKVKVNTSAVLAELLISRHLVESFIHAGALEGNNPNFEFIFIKALREGFLVSYQEIRRMKLTLIQNLPKDDTTLYLPSCLESESTVQPVPLVPMSDSEEMKELDRMSQLRIEQDREAKRSRKKRLVPATHDVNTIFNGGFRLKWTPADMYSTEEFTFFRQLWKESQRRVSPAPSAAGSSSSTAPIKRSH